MAIYKMDGGIVVNTDNATKSWRESQRFDGRNMISVATGTQWDHETLYRSRKGRYYVEHDSQYQGSLSYAEWISNHEAVRWLIANGYLELPDDLKTLEEEVCE
jgi:hypothetical protein